MIAEGLFVFFFKQKTAYDISRDWSSDVCSSDLHDHGLRPRLPQPGHGSGAEDGGEGRDRAVEHRRRGGDQYLLRSHDLVDRSEERRVGKECRAGGSMYHLQKSRTYNYYDESS